MWNWPVAADPGQPARARPHRPSPFDPWAALQAWQQTWLAGLDPAGAGRLLRAQRLADLIDVATRDAPLYARRARGARTLADFEPIGKGELMRHFDDWATDRRITWQGVQSVLQAGATGAGVADAWLDSFLLWTSPGTSGQPGVFVQDAAALAAYDAIDALRLRGLPGGMPAPGLWGLGRRFAYVGAIGGPYAGHVGMQRLRRMLPPPWTPWIDLVSALDPLPDVAARLRRLQPQVLITCPSCAVALAAAGAAAGLHLDELWLGGEQLGARQRALLRSAFGCTLRNSYGAAEFCAIANECHLEQLHLNDDWVVLEGVDAQGRPVGDGELSHSTWLTNLANRVQPLLRYQLTDRIRRLPGRCACGNPLPVIEVQGRSDDTLLLPGRDGRPVALLPLALETVLEEQAGVLQFQLLRHADGTLELRLPAGAGPGDFARCRQALRAFIAHHGALCPALLDGQAPPAQQPGSGKLRRVLDLAAAPA